MDPRTRTTIFISPVLKSLTSVDEKEGTLTYVHWLSMLWRDESLLWDPAMFNNITNIKIPASELWIRILFLRFSQEMRMLRSLEETFGTVTFTGNITVQLAQLVTIQCHYHIADFPFDKQECAMPYTSWIYAATEVELLPIDQEFAYYKTMENLQECLLTSCNFFSCLSAEFQENPEWNITGYDVEVQLDYYFINGQNITYPRAVYRLKFTRMPKWFIFTMVGPSVLITTIAIVGIFSPTNCDGQRAEKVTVGLTTLLTMAVILNLVCDQMPQSSLETPVLGLLVFYEMCVTSVCTCVGVLILFLHQKAVLNGWDPPKCFCKDREVFKNSNGCVPDEDFRAIPEAMLGSLKKSLKAFEKVMGFQDDDKVRCNTWAQIFNTIDTIFLFCALTFNVVMCMSVLSIGKFYYQQL